MTEPLPTTSRSLPLVLIKAREAIMCPIRVMLAETGITEQQWRVLRVLDETGPIAASKLAKEAVLLSPSLTRITVALSVKGLITQFRDENDRRRQVISITEEGRNLIYDKSEQAAKIIQGFRDNLGHDDFEQLLDLLSRLNKSV